MTTKNTIKLFSIFCLLSAFFLIHLTVTQVSASQANFPLEIINIKPAGTGNPAIPATNRIFRAYPGIEYNIRAAVIGGVYPYTYSLSNAPSGMAIDPNTGEISWPNPQSDAGPITLSVTDSKDTTVTTSWTINVTTSGFVFVDSSYSGEETGSLSKPFQSIYNMLSSTHGGDNTRMVYFRGGNYILPAWNSSPTSRIAQITGKAGTNLSQNPGAWIGYPNETVNINGDERFIYVASTIIYFDNLNLSNFSDYGLLSGSLNNYMTVRRCDWSNIVAVDTVNQNQGFIFLSRTGRGSYFVIQDNVFRDFTGASAIGSLYDHSKMLIENNNIFNSGGGGINGLNHPLMLKEHLDYCTIRGNRVVVNTGLPLNGRLFGSDHTEICFNLIMLESETRGQAAYFNTEGHLTEGATRTVYFHRNTVVGDLTFRFIDGDNCGKAGPWYFYNNIIINPNTTQSAPYYVRDFLSYNHGTDMAANPQNCIDDRNNLKGTSSDNIIDSTGILTPEFGQYLGSHGHMLGQVQEYLTPPSALRILE
jgi:hypothetical protein